MRLNMVTGWSVTLRTCQNLLSTRSRPRKENASSVEAARLFAERGFSQTDMAELASRANVAKGSVYDYFDSKEDLYLYVCRDGLERSRRAVYGGIDPSWDLYRKLRHIFRQGVKFADSYPEYVAMYVNISSAGMETFAEELSLEVEKFTADYLKGLIRTGVKQGLVRKTWM